MNNNIISTMDLSVISDMRNECWTSKNKVVGNPDDGKCLHLFDRGSLQKQ